jgi:hypothetical protein
MEHENELPAGAYELAIIDADIRHVRAAMLQSLGVRFDHPTLTVEYWRRRLNQLMRAHHLSRAQLRQVDALIAILDRMVREGCASKPEPLLTQFDRSISHIEEAPGSSH